MNISSPQRMVWVYFNALRRLIRTLDTAATEDEVRENVAVCVILAVSIVETFLNVLFRVVVSESGFTQHEPLILKDIENRKSLDYKLRSWPKIVFGKGVDFEEPTAQAFLVLKERRNRLMHFTSSRQTVAVPGIRPPLRGVYFDMFKMRIGDRTSLTCRAPMRRPLSFLIFGL